MMAALDPFDAAWMGVVAEIEGDAEPLLHFYERHAIRMQQDPYKTGVALSVEVPAPAWRWPAYISQAETALQEQDEDAPCGENYRDRCQIVNLDCSPDFNGSNFRPVEYLDVKGESRPMLHFVRRWHALGCRARNVAGFRESAKVVPGMTAKILPSGGCRVPCECKQLEGGPFPVGSPLLMQYAPCSRIDCSCCWVPVVPDWTSMVRP